MDVAITRQEEYLSVSWNSASAQINASEVKLGHMGCKLLGTLGKADRQEVEQ